MDAAVSVAQAGILQRATGELLVGVKRRGDASVLDELRQAGCLKARFPRPVSDGWIDVAMLNTSGGVAGGDRLNVAFHVQRDARATITTPAAERFYRALPNEIPAKVRNRLHLAAGAAAEWLPQESILFDHCALDRRLVVELADDARFLGLEALVFGRAAMGEQVARAWLRDGIRIRRAGRWLLHDSVRLDGEVDASLHRAAIAGGARAMATLVQVAPDAETGLNAARLALANAPVEAGASAWNGMLVARILAADFAALRRALIAALSVLRASRPLPRVWLC
ncbi:MAG TPA: urease accessory protein UreD [Acetobacteraceae bacterium]|nr:urease accessory protein UreD [Acetobacteraceae bacterium]